MGFMHGAVQVGPRGTWGTCMGLFRWIQKEHVHGHLGTVCVACVWHAWGSGRGSLTPACMGQEEHLHGIMRKVT